MKRRGFLKGLLALAGGSAVLPEDISRQPIAELRPKESPLRRLNEDLRSYRPEIYASIDRAVGSTSASSTTVPVLNPQFFRNGDVVHIPRTGEKMILISVDTVPITFQRGFGSKASRIRDEEPLWIIGNTGNG